MMSIIMDDINPNLLKAISTLAKKKNKTETKVLEDILEKELGNAEESTIEDIVKNNPKLKFMKKSSFQRSSGRKSFEDMIGIIEAPKGFNPVKAVREVRRGDL